MTLARALIIATNHDAGRGRLRELLAKDVSRSTLDDEAQFWIGVSYNYQRDHENAKKGFGVYLRDYPNSRNAGQIKGKFPPACPVKR